jgi:hypothetical protein
VSVYRAHQVHKDYQDLEVCLGLQGAVGPLGMWDPLVLKVIRYVCLIMSDRLNRFHIIREKYVSRLLLKF